MQQWITNVLTKYMGDWYFPQVGVTDILEILIISVIVYQIMKWIMNTKAWMLLRGILMLGLFILCGGVL